MGIDLTLALAAGALILTGALVAPAVLRYCTAGSPPSRSRRIAGDRRRSRNGEPGFQPIPNLSRTRPKPERTRSKPSRGRGHSSRQQKQRDRERMEAYFDEPERPPERRGGRGTACNDEEACNVFTFTRSSGGQAEAYEIDDEIAPDDSISMAWTRPAPAPPPRLVCKRNAAAGGGTFRAAASQPPSRSRPTPAANLPPVYDDDEEAGDAAPAPRGGVPQPPSIPAPPAVQPPRCTPVVDDITLVGLNLPGPGGARAIVRPRR